MKSNCSSANLLLQCPELCSMLFDISLHKPTRQLCLAYLLREQKRKLEGNLLTSVQSIVRLLCQIILV